MDAAPDVVAAAEARGQARDLWQTVNDLYAELQAAGLDVLFDDRDVRPGVKFADMELIGIPHRVVIGERGLADGNVEYKARAADEAKDVPLADIVKLLKTSIQS